MAESLSYQDAGVDIDAGNQLVNNIKDMVAATHQPGVLSGLGGFGGLFELPIHDYKKPVLVSCTDGVGTKLAIAIELGVHHTIGIDCVAMCVNDCVVSGAKPLWFLDYFATGKLSTSEAQEVIQGITQACQHTQIALLGGETAEMPGMYKTGDYDLAGFCVGVVEKNKILDNNSVKAGDVLIGLPSSGIHSNGFSLVRKVLEKTQINLSDTFDTSTMGDVLIEPTRLYVNQTLALCEQNLIKSCAHITGGGLTENLPRSFPDHLQANIDLTSWQRAPIFSWLQQHVSQDDMLKTFNCGVGMTYIVASEKADACIKTLESLGEQPIILGTITDDRPSPVTYEGTL